MDIFYRWGGGSFPNPNLLRHMVMFGYFFRKDLAIFQGKGGRMTKSKILGEVKNTGGGGLRPFGQNPNRNRFFSLMAFLRDLV